MHEVRWYIITCAESEPVIAFFKHLRWSFFIALSRLQKKNFWKSLSLFLNLDINYFLNLFAQSVFAQFNICSTKYQDWIMPTEYFYARKKRIFVCLRIIRSEIATEQRRVRSGGSKGRRRLQWTTCNNKTDVFLVLFYFLIVKCSHYNLYTQVTYWVMKKLRSAPFYFLPFTHSV